jgi:hypothetical protein
MFPECVPRLVDALSNAAAAFAAAAATFHGIFERMRDG